MMEQRNQMLRELRLNKKESLGIVSREELMFFFVLISVCRAYYLIMYLLCKVSSLVDFNEIASEEKLPLVIF